MYKFQTITFEKNDGIGLITLNRPERLNAISHDMVDELLAVQDSLVSDPECRVLVITGAGRGFCSGTDLKSVPKVDSGDMMERTLQRYARQKRVSDIMLKMRQIPQPVIAAVNGVASGGGMCLALAADIRVAGNSAKFNAAFINMGLTGGDLGSSYFLPRLVGISRASEILFTGRWVEAEEALNIGLISRITHDEEVLDAALEIARSMLEKSALGLRLTKELLNTTLQNSLEAGLQVENRQQVLCMLSGAWEAGINRYMKRKE